MELITVHRELASAPEEIEPETVALIAPVVTP
jgi:hypothetical protein